MDGKTRRTSVARVFAEIAIALGTCPEVRSALSLVAEKSIPQLADWCFCCLLGDTGIVEQVEVKCHQDTAWNIQKELASHSIFSNESAYNWLKAIRNPTIFGALNETWLERMADSDLHRVLLQKIGFRSALIAPVGVNGEVSAWLLYFLCHSHRVFSETDLQTVRVITALLDLTFVVQSNVRSIVNRAAALEKAMQVEQEYVAILSHELQNSIASISSWSRYLKSQVSPNENILVAQGVRAIQRNAEISARLAAQCSSSDFKVQSQLNCKLLDLNDVLRACIEDARVRADSKEIEVVNAVCIEPLTVLGDEFKLQQAFANLLINGIKYNRKGGHVQITSRHNGRSAEIKVEDDGIGIEEDLLNEIFKPFYRRDNSPSELETGLGLGLSITSHIVSLHGGMIWATSEGPSHGSIFHVRVPTVNAQPDPSPSPTPAELGESAGPIRILLVEDAKEVLALTKMELEALGHVVLPVANAIDGVETAQRERPDLIISDLNLTGLNGYEFIQALRATPEGCRIPAIALSGFGRALQRQRAIQAGFDACLTKPAEPEELISTISKLTKAGKSLHN